MKNRVTVFWLLLFIFAPFILESIGGQVGSIGSLVWVFAVFGIFLYAIIRILPELVRCWRAPDSCA